MNKLRHNFYDIAPIGKGIVASHTAVTYCSDAGLSVETSGMRNTYVSIYILHESMYRYDNVCIHVLINVYMLSPHLILGYFQ